MRDVDSLKNVVILADIGQDDFMPYKVARDTQADTGSNRIYCFQMQGGTAEETRRVADWVSDVRRETLGGIGPAIHVYLPKDGIPVPQAANISHAGANVIDPDSMEATLRRLRQWSDELEGDCAAMSARYVQSHAMRHAQRAQDRQRGM